MKLLYSRFHIAIFDIFGDISGAGLSQGPAFGALYRALGAPDKKMIETRNRVRVWGKLFYFRSYVENVDSFWVLLSTKIDWNTESRKVGKSESRKLGKSEMSSDSKNFFFLVFLGPNGVQIRKKNKSENFEKFGHFLLPVLRNKAQGLTPSGKKTGWNK